jgi:hypothetical protein
VGGILTSVCPCLLPLVDWFNAVDATYRGDLRELNEVNYARFEAKLELRIAEHAFAQLNARIDRVVAEVVASLERGRKEQTRWLLLAWGTVLAGVIGLLAHG